MSYSRGEIVLVLFPNSDLKTVKHRPVLVVQAMNLNTGLSHQIMVSFDAMSCLRDVLKRQNITV